jgi:RHS repeat-associated protein
VTTTITYTNCEISSDMDPVAFPCPAPKPAGRISALWNPGVCPTWTSIPAIVEVANGAGDVLRKRDGRTALCDNSSMTVTHEYYGTGADDYVETLLDYDDWGTYNFIAYPDSDPDDGLDERYTVDYVWEDTGHANITEVVDSYGLKATSVYDDITGRIKEQTDVNGQKTSYTYDAAGRLKSIRGPKEQPKPPTVPPTVPPPPVYDTITFEYFPTASGYAYAVAHHFDSQRPTNPIDSVAFVDGTGRETQTKQDGHVFVDEATAGGAARMIVSGAVEFDPLGRPIKEWYPITEPPGAAGTYNYNTSSVDETVMTWRLDDVSTGVTLPEGFSTTTAYDFGVEPRTGATMFKRTETDPLGKVAISYTDVREQVLAVDDRADPTDPLVSTYEYDPIGQLVASKDPNGNVTTHAYDLLGRRTATETPDGGLVETVYDNAGNAIAEIDPIQRAAAEEITYDYDFNRLVGINYPDPETPDVTYTYGDNTHQSINGAGRVIEIDDGAKNQKLEYDEMGNVAKETSLIKTHAFASDPAANTYVTTFTYDGFGRLQDLTYPDGEVISHGYDSGGHLARVTGANRGFDYVYLDRLEYDEFGDKAFQRTGNGVTTRYTYDPETRWLSNQLSISPEREIQDLNYTYDDAGNVETFKNNLPAPASNLMLGPSSQNYHYDAHYRIDWSDGTFDFAPDKTRKYFHDVDYDRRGNVIKKVQTDEIFAKSTGGGKPKGGGGGNNGNSAGSANNGLGIQAGTTYSLSPIQYSQIKPHQVMASGGKTFEHDDNGRLEKIVGPDGKDERVYTWDQAARVRTIQQQGSTTDYAYDDLGRLTIERGPSGETSFVNQWVTKVNGGKMWKTIWAAEDRLSTKLAQPDPDPLTGLYVQEATRFFFHKDLQGSTNVVTGDTGLVFQHIEYFPSGETWVHENSNVHNTPYLFTGVYYDEARKLLNHGERWYSTKEQNMLSPDPLLVEQPLEAVDDPALVQAYTYASSNPLRFTDTEGRASRNTRAAFSSPLKLIKGIPRPVNTPLMSPAQAATKHAKDVKSAMRYARAGVGPALWKVKLATSTRGEKLQAFSDRFEAKPLLKINLVAGPKGWKLQDIRVKPFSSISKLKKQWDFDGYNQKQSASANPAGSQLATNGQAANSSSSAQATSQTNVGGPATSTPANAPGGTPARPTTPAPASNPGTAGAGSGPATGAGATSTNTSTPSNNPKSN